MIVVHVDFRRKRLLAAADMKRKQHAELTAFHAEVRAGLHGPRVSIVGDPPRPDQIAYREGLAAKAERVRRIRARGRVGRFAHFMFGV